MQEAKIEELTTEEVDRASGGLTDLPDWIRNVGDLRRWLGILPP